MKPSETVKTGRRKCCWKPRTKSINPAQNTTEKSKSAEPKIGVISCGRDNDYGHPHEETLSRLNDAGVTVYRTDLEGSIVIFSDGMKVERRAA